MSDLTRYTSWRWLGYISVNGQRGGQGTFNVMAMYLTLRAGEAMNMLQYTATCNPAGRGLREVKCRQYYPYPLLERVARLVLGRFSTSVSECIRVQI